MPEITVRPLATLLVDLIGSNDLGAIAANTYVAPAGSGTPAAPAPGLLADPDAAALAEAGGAEAAPLATEAGRSLAGLRPPLRPGGDPAPDAAGFPRAGLGPARSDGGAARPDAAPGAGREAAPAAGAGPSAAARSGAPATPSSAASRGQEPPGAAPAGPAPASEPAPERGIAPGATARIQAADIPLQAAVQTPAQALPDAAAHAALRPPGTPHDPPAQPPAQPGHQGAEPRRDARMSERAGSEAERVPARPEAGPAAASAQERPPAAALGLAALDGWSPTPGLAADQQVERAGVIASFILNAAMIPGWPPPRPFAAPAPGAVLAALVQMPGSPEDGIEERMRRRGARRTLLARMRALLARLARSRRLQVMLGLTILLGAIAAIEAELGELARRDDADTDVEASRRRLSV